MKKIVCLIDSLISGGAQRQLVGLACLLKLNGFDVSVMTYHDIPFYADQLKKADVPYEVITGASNTKIRPFLIYGALKKANPDIVIAYLDVPCILACLTKLFGGKFKLIVSERNTTQNLTNTEKLKFFLYKFADAIIPNSYSQTKFIINHYPKFANKVTTITNFVDTSFFRPDSSISRENNLNILSIGRVSEQKNILRYIEAINIIKSKGFVVRVDWYGKKFESYYEKCIEKIRKYQLENVFIFHDASRNIVPAYSKADVFCLPSIYEGFPNVICEAMSCGLPILCSNVCDNPEIVKGDKNGILFNPLSVEDMASAILKFHKLSLSQRNTMRSESRKMAIGNFSSESFIEKYINLINSL